MSSVGTLEDPSISSRNSIAVTTTISHRSRIATPESNQISLTSNSSPQNAMRSCPDNGSNSPRSPAPCSPTKSPGYLQPLMPLNPNSPRRYRPLPIGRYRATAYAAPLASGEFATLPSPHIPVFRPAEHVRRHKETADIFSYFKVAFLLFIALVVVWVPSGINRLHQIFFPNRPVYGLNLASAIVLPMQGFWNALIYAQATWSECNGEFAKIVWKLKGTNSRKEYFQTDGINFGKDRASVETKATQLTSRSDPAANDSIMTV